MKKRKEQSKQSIPLKNTKRHVSSTPTTDSNKKIKLPCLEHEVTKKFTQGIAHEDVQGVTKITPNASATSSTSSTASIEATKAREATKITFPSSETSIDSKQSVAQDHYLQRNAFKSIRDHVLSQIASPPQHYGYDKQIKTITEILSNLVSHHCNRSVLCLGHESTGKSDIVRQVLLGFRETIHNVWVDGSKDQPIDMHMKDLSDHLQEIHETNIDARTNDTVLVNDTNAILFDHLSRLGSIDHRKSLVIVLDNIDSLISLPNGQSFLYTLCDLLYNNHTKKSSTILPIVIIALTSRRDIYEFLDKRLKSRLNSVVIQFPLNLTIQHVQAMFQFLLLVPCTNGGKDGIRSNTIDQNADTDVDTTTQASKQKENKDNKEKDNVTSFYSTVQEATEATEATETNANNDFNSNQLIVYSTSGVTSIRAYNAYEIMSKTKKPATELTSWLNAYNASVQKTIFDPLLKQTLDTQIQLGKPMSWFRDLAVMTFKVWLTSAASKVLTSMTSMTSVEQFQDIMLKPEYFHQTLKDINPNFESSALKSCTSLALRVLISACHLERKSNGPYNFALLYAGWKSYQAREGRGICGDLKEIEFSEIQFRYAFECLLKDGLFVLSAPTNKINPIDGQFSNHQKKAITTLQNRSLAFAHWSGQMDASEHHVNASMLKNKSHPKTTSRQLLKSPTNSKKQIHQRQQFVAVRLSISPLIIINHCQILHHRGIKEFASTLIN